MSGHIDQRLGFSAQFEQAHHGWQAARHGGFPAAGVTWLTELHGIVERTNNSEALRTIENTYHTDLRSLAADIADLAAMGQEADTAAPDFWERGDQLFERAFGILDGAGL
ncbi:MAG TPA: hypothetical protein VIL85_02435 [Thermomicrobiales bacterium]|jgi:hypothetical protein